MKTIPLSQGQVTKVSDVDYPRLARHKWYARWNRYTRSFYTARNSEKVEGKRHQIQMARAILGLAYKDPRKADHAMHDTLDNRRRICGRVNLRIADSGQNARNRRKHRNNTSGSTGIDQHKGKWRARICFNLKLIDLGYFSSRARARKARKAKELELFGDFRLQG